MREKLRVAVLWIYPVLAAPAFAAAGETTAGERPPDTSVAELPGEFLGCWQSTKDERLFVHFQQNTVTFSKGGQWQVARILRYQPGQLTLRIYGARKIQEARLDGGLLKLNIQTGEAATEFKKLDQVPEPVVLRPMELGRPDAVAADRVKVIGEELSRRAIEDQAVRTDKARHKDMGKVDADNTAYLKTLVKEMGWLDAQRFGAKTAGTAFLIVQHSGDLPLMMAALPEIEKDVKAKRIDSQDFALLFDRLQLRLGNKQRYGTQVGVNSRGEQVVMSLEDPEKVEAIRREIGLFPLAQYLSYFGEVKILRDESD